MKGFLGEFAIQDHEFSAYTPKDWALEYLARYSYIDGAHHKQWVLDQVARILHGTPVIVTAVRWAGGHKELRFRTGEVTQDYLDWLDDDFDLTDTDAVGIAP